MLPIYISFIITLELIICLFGFLFSVYPGKKYRLALPKIYMILSFLILAGATLTFVLSCGCGDTLAQLDSLFEPEFCILLFVLSSMIFLPVAIKSIGDIKKGKTQPLILLEVKKDEYSIKRKLDTTIGDYVYMPHVETYAVTKDKIIAFSGKRPTALTDATLICRKITEKMYDCISFIEHNKKISFRRAVQSIETFSVILVLMSLPILAAVTDHMFIHGFSIKTFTRYFAFSGIYIFGVLSKKLFYNAHGVGKLFYWFGVASSILAFVKFVR